MAQKDCVTVTVQAPEEDQSTGSIVENSVSASSPAVETVNITYELTNKIVSGDGQNLDVDVAFTVAGQQYGTDTVSINAGSTKTLTNTIEGVPGGEQEVCVEKVNETVV